MHDTHDTPQVFPTGSFYLFSVYGSMSVNNGVEQPSEVGPGNRSRYPVFSAAKTQAQSVTNNPVSKAYMSKVLKE